MPSGAINGGFALRFGFVSVLAGIGVALIAMACLIMRFNIVLPGKSFIWVMRPKSPIAVSGFPSSPAICLAFQKPNAQCCLKLAMLHKCHGA